MSEPQQPPLPSPSQGTHDLTPTGHVAPEPAYPPYATESAQSGQSGQPPAYPPQPGQTAQPAYPGQPAPTASNAYAGFTGTPALSETGNPLGRAALLIAVIAFGVSLLSMLMTPFLYMSGNGPVLAGMITTMLSVVVGLAAIVALILGIMALRRPAPHILAGIAVGIAATEILSRAVGWISSLFYTFL